MDLKMEGSFIATVVLTGLIVVFLGLVILIVCVKIMDLIFTTIEKRKSAKSEKSVDEAVQPVAAVEAASSAPEIEGGISDEIVAVIAAAVASMSGGYTLKSIRKSKSSRRTAWGAQGISESTRIF